MKTKNLTIQEAIQSGLPFKREKWTNYCERGLELASFGIGDLDILATDWQIKVPEVTITREKLAEAWDKTVGSVLILSKNSDSFLQMCKELGL